MPKEIVSTQAPAEIASQAVLPTEVPALSVQIVPVAVMPEPLPQAGGSYVRQESGELKLVARTAEAGPTLATDPTDLIKGE